MLDWITAAVRRRVQKLTEISRYIQADCATPWTAIASVLPGAAAQPALSLLTFGLDDVLRGYVRPRGVRAPTKMRRPQRWYNRPTIPEIGEEIGKRLPGRDQLAARKIGTLERAAWIADGALQRLGYHALVVDAVLDTWYNSVVALQQRGYCKRPYQAAAARAGDGLIWFRTWGPFRVPEYPTPPAYTSDWPRFLDSLFTITITLLAPDRGEVWARPMVYHRHGAPAVPLWTRTVRAGEPATMTWPITGRYWSAWPYIWGWFLGTPDHPPHQTYVDITSSVSFIFPHDDGRP